LRNVSKLPEVEVGALSVAGPVREDNQDAILCPNGSAPALAGLLHAVADGMGGYSFGGLASDLALKALTAQLADRVSTPPGKALRSGMEAANLDVYKASQRMGAGRMGTTLTAAYLIGDTLHLAHVGDSRAYLLRDGHAACLTSDHTVVGDMVRSRLIPPERLRTHAQRSVLTRAIGLGLFIQPDLSRVQVKAGDRIVLCSDGVWSVILDDEFAGLAGSTPTPRALSQQLVDLALERQTDDNCSVVAIHIQGFRSVSMTEEPSYKQAWPSWLHK
jgi:serine/threonine protein phosphatase PrpC